MAGSSIVIVLQLIFLEGILSLGNAAVLGAMAAAVPQEQPIPWPAWLRGVEQPASRLLGRQREAVLKVGMLGAYLGRLLMLLATFIVQHLWLRLLGALYLVHLAVAYLAQFEQAAKHGAKLPADRCAGHGRSAGFWPTVLAIELADLAFSLDNVVAALLLSDQVWVVMVGMALGMLTMRFAASLFARLILWEPALQTGAYVLVLSLAVEVLVKELLHLAIGEWAQFSLSVSLLGATVLMARSPLPLLRTSWGVLFRALYLPFGLVAWLLHVGDSPFPHPPADLGSGG